MSILVLFSCAGKYSNLGVNVWIIWLVRFIVSLPPDWYRLSVRECGCAIRMHAGVRIVARIKVVPRFSVIKENTRGKKGKKQEEKAAISELFPVHLFLFLRYIISYFLQIKATFELRSQSITDPVILLRAVTGTTILHCFECLGNVNNYSSSVKEGREWGQWLKTILWTERDR